MVVLRFYVLFVWALALIFFSTSLAIALPSDKNDKWTNSRLALEEARMLRFKKIPAVRFCTAEQLYKLRLEQFRRLFIGDKIMARSIMLQNLGLWPKDRNLETTLNSLFPNLPLDWYDPNDGSIVCALRGDNLNLIDALGLEGKYRFLFSSFGLDIDNMYRTYLLEHALQDQWFDLKRLYRGSENMDSSLATIALCEGDALFSTIISLTESMGMKPNAIVDGINSISPNRLNEIISKKYPAFGEVPFVFKESLNFILLDGLKFASTVRQRGGWGNLNRALREGMLSSKQILHPIVYVNGNMIPVQVKLSKPREIPGLKYVGEDCAGEFIVRCLAKSYRSESDKYIGGGWLGDRWYAYIDPKSGDNDTALVWVSVWQDGESADRFATLMRKIGAYVKIDAKEHSVVAICGATAEQRKLFIDMPIAIEGLAKR